MRIVLLIMLLCGCSNANGTQASSPREKLLLRSNAQQGNSTSQNTIAMNAMSKDLIGKRQLDDLVVINVERKTDCLTAISTRRGTILINWSSMMNATPYLANSHQILPFSDTDGRSHKLDMGTGHGNYILDLAWRVAHNGVTEGRRHDDHHRQNLSR